MKETPSLEQFSSRAEMHFRVKEASGMARSRRGTCVINQGQGSCLRARRGRLGVELVLQVVRQRKFHQGMAASNRHVSWASVMDVA